jgi:hypothetical protein
MQHLTHAVRVTLKPGFEVLRRDFNHRLSVSVQTIHHVEPPARSSSILALAEVLR